MKIQHGDIGIFFYHVVYKGLQRLSQQSFIHFLLKLHLGVYVFNRSNNNKQSKYIVTFCMSMYFVKKRVQLFKLISPRGELTQVQQSFPHIFSLLLSTHLLGQNQIRNNILVTLNRFKYLFNITQMLHITRTTRLIYIYIYIYIQKCPRKKLHEQS